MVVNVQLHLYHPFANNLISAPCNEPVIKGAAPFPINEKSNNWALTLLLSLNTVAPNGFTNIDWVYCVKSDKLLVLPKLKPSVEFPWFAPEFNLNKCDDKTFLGLIAESATIVELLTLYGLPALLKSSEKVTKLVDCGSNSKEGQLPSV